MDFRYTDIEVNRNTENIWADHAPVETLDQLQTFGDRLLYWRKLRGFGHGKQGFVAEKLGIKQPSLSELESGKSEQPSADVLLKACDLLGLRPRYLLYGEMPAEGLNFAEISGEEAQLVMIYRGLPDGMKHGLIIDATAAADRAKQASKDKTKAAKKRETAN